MQPAIKSDPQHTNKVWDRLMPLHQHWQSLLPPGGPIPEEAKCYFSPCFLWTRLPLGEEGEGFINNVTLLPHAITDVVPIDQMENDS